MTTNYIDLRSDTCSLPTEEMLEAMRRAEVGNAGFGEDPTVNKLEELAADKMGKEAAMFVPSGTMANQVALMTHTKKGDEVIFESEAHIYINEVGGFSVLANLTPWLIKGTGGAMDPDEVEKAVKTGDNITQPPTSLICLENTHNRVGGKVISVENFQKIKEVADRHNLKVHVDGERLYDAAVHLNVDITEFTKHVDSVMIGLSKNLCAPIGSILAGDKDFIARARKYMKMLGGVMRQAGYMAAPGIIALEKMVDRLAEDHEHARILAEGIANVEGIHLNPDDVETNIVKFGVRKEKWNAPKLVAELKNRGVLCNSIDDYYIRMVLYRDITKKDVLTTVQDVNALLREE